MIDRTALRALAEALPVGTAVPVPREWILELLGGGVIAQTSAPEVADPAIPQLAARFKRSPSTIRGWIELGRFPGAYRLRGREWRVPAAGVAAFEAAERNGGSSTSESKVSAAAPAGRTVDLGAWRKVG